jgi:hypothetical protein
VDNERHAMKGRLLSVKEVAEILRKKPDTIRRYYLKSIDGKPPRIKPYRDRPKNSKEPILVWYDDLLKFMNGRENQEG